MLLKQDILVAHNSTLEYICYSAHELEAIENGKVIQHLRGVFYKFVGQPNNHFSLCWKGLGCRLMPHRQTNYIIILPFTHVHQ